MRHRFNLFEKFCYPSVRRQTNQDFEWLVFFDADTQEEFGKRIDHYRNGLSAFRPIFVPDYQCLIPEIRRLVRNDTKYLITTRVDNDDAIHREYVSVIQETFHGQECEFVNLTQGFFLSNGRLYLCRDPSNPFISLIERVAKGSERTVWCGEHTKLRHVAPVRQLDDKPRWIRVVHERNAATQPVKESAGYGHPSRAKQITKWLLYKLGLLPKPRPIFSLQKKPLPVQLSDVAEQFGLEQVAS